MTCQRCETIGHEHGFDGTAQAVTDLVCGKLGPARYFKVPARVMLLKMELPDTELRYLAGAARNTVRSYFGIGIILDRWEQTYAGIA